MIQSDDESNGDPAEVDDVDSDEDRPHDADGPDIAQWERIRGRRSAVDHFLSDYRPVSGHPWWG